VKDNQIPNEGRLLQCGNCKHKWFFKKTLKSNDKNIEFNERKVQKQDVKEPDEIKTNIKLSKQVNEQNEKVESNTKVDFNKFKFFIFILILILAFIILIDTFKIQISYIYPDIYTIMNSLYETLKDLKLFFLDLIR
tara:strand:+ start:166 stop:573 length:408 start_codon:yes stop_codon:yes gene_type:complete